MTTENRVIGPASTQLQLLQGGTGPAVVLLHGIQRDACVWSAVAPRLTQRYTVVAPHLRGRAASHRPTRAIDYSLTAFAEDLAVVIDQLLADGHEHVRLVGWSMGASVALEYLNWFGAERVKQLVLVSGNPAPGDVGLLQAHTLTGGTARAAPGSAGADNDSIAAPFVVAASRRGLRVRDLRPMLADVTMATLVVHGSADKDCPIEAAHEMHRRIPRSRWVELPDVGHAVPVDAAEPLLTALMDFFDEENDKP